MMNTLAAAIRLTNYQMMGTRRRWVTIAIFLLPILIALAAAIFGRNVPLRQYTRIISGLFANVVIPFLGVFWGSVLISDEVEGKTLVYLWTRPVGRAKLLMAKFLPLLFWLAVFLVPTLASVCAILYSRRGTADVLAHLNMVVWDTRSLYLGGLTYAAIGFFLATLFKRPLMVGLVYLFVVDSLVVFMPGFLKQLSVRYYMYLLGSNPKEGIKAKGFFEFLSSETTTSEPVAIITLCLVTIALVVAGAAIAKSKEFSSDDPARAT